MSVVVSTKGDGELEFSPSISEFEAAIPDLVHSMAQAAVTLPALEVATIDVKFHEDTLSPIFSDELSLNKYVSLLFLFFISIFIFG